MKKHSKKSNFHPTVNINNTSFATVLRMSTRMRLRTRIQAPERFEDEDYDTPAASNPTRPPFPRLLKEQTISFDPHLPPAAVPSLTRVNPQIEDDGRMLHDVAEPAYVDMMDIGFQTDSLTSLGVAVDAPPFRRSFLDDSETSNEEEGEVSFPRATTPVKPFDSN
jgi:hypothetical protein